ncbi:MAG: methyltransferase domain-containing protein [Actinomyces sp.]|uniref:methyltransferase domain-containing protein n=1 Tax=Actinomyces sp. TaxID=29317 RepID=UPI0026DD55EA|nr:methyltransferase domain-containing protein [Actinomyces sp.]MDO4244114.1 methyltransferase domain-containing protein [Actinomyces sp.]
MRTPQTTYTHGHGAAVLASHSHRRAADSAAYLLPHLRAGLDLLDVGCGPATITADLARAVAPGRVVGLDGAPAALVAAGATLAAQGLEDAVELVAGDIHELPFADGSFDVVHAHQVLQHVADPVAAAREMRRVTRPGGLVAARDAVYSAMTWYPRPAGMEAWRETYMATARANSGEPDAGAMLLSWFRAAGMTSVEATASSGCYATGEDRQWWGSTWAERCLTSFGPQARRLGLADDEGLRAVVEAWRQWAAAEDGWFAVLHGEVLARV